MSDEVEQNAAEPTERRFVFALRDLLALVIGCGVYLGLLRMVVGFDTNIETLLPNDSHRDDRGCDAN